MSRCQNLRRPRLSIRVTRAWLRAFARDHGPWPATLASVIRSILVLVGLPVLSLSAAPTRMIRASWCPCFRDCQANVTKANNKGCRHLLPLRVPTARRLQPADYFLETGARRQSPTAKMALKARFSEMPNAAQRNRWHLMHPPDGTQRHNP